MGISNLSTGLRPGVCTSTTRPTAPFNGQVIYETDTKQTLVYNGSTWVMLTDADTPPGVQLIKTQAVGTNVTSITVTDAFSSEFDKYEIVWTGGIGTVNAYGINVYLGSTRTGYYTSGMWVDYNGSYSAHNVSNGNEFAAAGIMTTEGAFCNFTLIQPYNTKFTYYTGNYIYGAVGGGGGSISSISGYLNNANSYTSFTLFVSAGITGGTIRVYGYRNTI